jgi:cell shape-determining protein MreD
MLECNNVVACLLGQMLGAVVDSWDKPYFLSLGTISFFVAMLFQRWRWVALLGLAIAILPLAILFVALTVEEAASIQLTGRVIPTVLGGIMICSLGWLIGRTITRYLCSHSNLCPHSKRANVADQRKAPPVAQRGP